MDWENRKLNETKNEKIVSKENKSIVDKTAYHVKRFGTKQNLHFKPDDIKPTFGAHYSVHNKGFYLKIKAPLV